MQKWEYLNLTILAVEYNRFETIMRNGEATRVEPPWKFSDIYEYINKLGEEGWEMVNSESWSYNFKRPIE